MHAFRLVLATSIPRLLLSPPASFYNAVTSGDASFGRYKYEESLCIFPIYSRARDYIHAYRRIERERERDQIIRMLQIFARQPLFISRDIDYSDIT